MGAKLKKIGGAYAPMVLSALPRKYTDMYANNVWCQRFLLMDIIQQSDVTHISNVVGSTQA